MVRTQLYLPEDVYKSLKKEAKKNKMTFAGYVRVYLEREALPEKKKKSKKDILKRFPFLKYSGAFSWGANSSDNDNIDEALYGNLA